MQNFKNILIASDFSKHSDNAIEFTKNIHKKLGSQVSLIHISDVSPVWDWPASDIQAKNLLGQFQKEINNALDQKMRDQMNRCDADFNGVIKFGNSQKELIAYIESSKADLLVMGHRGQTGFFGIGSFAEKMIASSPIPVLVVKDNTEITNITCLLDPAKISKRSLEVTKDLGHTFAATKRFLSYIADLCSESLISMPFVMPSYKFSEQEKFEIVEKAKSYILGQDNTLSATDIEIEVSALSANKALAKVLATTKTDLAIVSRHNRGPVEKLFIGSTSKGILNGFEGNILVMPS